MNYNNLCKLIPVLWIMGAVLPLNAAHQEQDFATLLKRVKQTQEKSLQGDVSDFSELPLSSLTYQEALKQYFPPWQPDVVAIIDSMWAGCNYTAPLTLAWLAPEQSYQGQEKAFHAVAQYGYLNNSLPNNKLIHRGMDTFEDLIKSFESSEESAVILCNIFYQNHVFLVHKIGKKIPYYTVLL